MNNLISQCVDNLEQKWNQNNETLPMNIDLILDGGAFGGSYTLGSLYYLQELIVRNKIVLHRISGVSIGSIMGFLLMANRLDDGIHLYRSFFNYFKENGCLSIFKKTLRKITSSLPKDFYLQCNYKLYISYFDCKKNKHVTQYHYKSNKDLSNAMLRSSFVPFLITGNLLLKNKYLDGLYPYIFPKQYNIKRIFIDLTPKLFKMLYIKHEIHNVERIMEGILDIHHLLFHNIKKKFCSFVDDWNITYKSYIYVRTFISDFYVWLIHIYLKYFRNEFLIHFKRYFNFILQHIAKYVLV
jgi:hypothetical protein